VVAIIGLTTWKKELKGKSEYQLAKEVLKSVYRVRGGFNHVRNPMLDGREYPEDTILPNGMVYPEKEYEAQCFAYDNRWKYLMEALKELEEKHLMAVVEWGPEHQEKIQPIRACAFELEFQIRQYLEDLRNPERAEWQQQHMSPESFEKRNKTRMTVLYNTGSDGEYNQFTERINAAIDTFDDWLQEKIE
jgi:hypothetical protein